MPAPGLRGRCRRTSSGRYPMWTLVWSPSPPAGRPRRPIARRSSRSSTRPSPSGARPCARPCPAGPAAPTRQRRSSPERGWIPARAGSPSPWSSSRRSPPHARLHLRKQIPVAGGLAGGGADAAAALVACDALWGTGLSRDDLGQLAVRVGSDVPFLVHGGTALGTGRGETVSPVLARSTSWHWVVAIADGGLSTPAVYQELDRLRETGAGQAPPGPTDDLLGALRPPDPAGPAPPP